MSFATVKDLPISILQSFDVNISLRLQCLKDVFGDAAFSSTTDVFRGTSRSISKSRNGLLRLPTLQVSPRRQGSVEREYSNPLLGYDSSFIHTRDFFSTHLEVGCHLALSFPKISASRFFSLVEIPGTWNSA